MTQTEDEKIVLTAPRKIVQFITLLILVVVNSAYSVYALSTIAFRVSEGIFLSPDWGLVLQLVLFLAGTIGFDLIGFGILILINKPPKPKIEAFVRPEEPFDWNKSV